MTMRLAKWMAHCGVCSRRAAEDFIRQGRVCVNGEVVDSPAFNVEEETDKVLFDGEKLTKPQAARLWLYHKPTGLVTSHKDEKGRPTVFETLPKNLPRVISVGRLDLNSEGLLLLTNNGELSRKLELPSNGWFRRYRVRVFGMVKEEVLATLQNGVCVDGVSYGPIKVTVDSRQGANAWLTVSLSEGKNREIRKVLKSLGLEVSRLIRVSYGPFQLGNLKKGDVREVPHKVLREQLGKVFEG